MTTTQSTQTEVDDRWVRLEVVVAAGLATAFAAVMLLLARTVVVPLAVGAALLCLAAASTTRWPRAGALVIGGLAGLQAVLSLANLPLVLDDLSRPALSASFLVAFALQVVPLVGVVGLVGILCRAPGRMASLALLAGGGLLAAGLAVGLLAGAA